MKYDVKDKGYKAEFYFEDAVCHIFKSRRYAIGIKIFGLNEANIENINIIDILRCVESYSLKNDREKSIFDYYLNRELIKPLSINIELENLKIDEKDIKYIKNGFTALRRLVTYNCRFDKNCNIGLLNCNFSDEKSNIYSLDILNNFCGDFIVLEDSNIENENINFLHLNCVSMELRNIEIDYEKFFLTTDAPNLKELIINKKYITRDIKEPELSEIKRKINYLHDKDFLFISGFYNLEQININGQVSNYDSFEKLDRLKKIENIYIGDISMEACHKLVLQNIRQDFLEKIYVEKLTKVEWYNKIVNDCEEKTKQELIELSKKLSSEKKFIGRYTLTPNISIDRDINNVKNEDESRIKLVQIQETSPFDDDNLCKDSFKYYTLSKKIKL